MSLGLFFIVVKAGNIERKAIFSPEGLPDDQLLGENAEIRVRMGHQDKRQLSTILPESQIFSISKQIDIRRTIYSLIIGVILTKEEDSVGFRDLLERYLDELEEGFEKPEEDLKKLLKEIYDDIFTQKQMAFDRTALEKRLSERAKELNKSGKFEEATEVLDKLKKIPKKLQRIHSSAENALQNREYERAVRDFNAAKKLAEEIYEDDLAKMYTAKIQLANKTPALLKKREKYLKDAMDNLRNDRFDRSQRAFKKAADVSEELMDLRGAEEFNLKARALAEYVKADRKYK